MPWIVLLYVHIQCWTSFEVNFLTSKNEFLSAVVGMIILIEFFLRIGSDNSKEYFKNIFITIGIIYINGRNIKTTDLCHHHFKMKYSRLNSWLKPIIIHKNVQLKDLKNAWIN